MAEYETRPGAPAGRSSARVPLQKPDDKFAPGELPRISDVDPVAIHTIIKLDQRSMVWAYEGVATDVEAISPFLSIIIAIGLAAGLWLMWDILSGEALSDTSIVIRIAFFVICLFVEIVGAWFIVYMLKNSLFSAYGDLHFNRYSRTIYTAENNKAVRMNWANVRPYAVVNFGPVQFGAPVMMSLQLAEFTSPDSNTLISSFIVAGPLPNRKGCQEVWELIRRYMEEPPSNLPQLEVVPGARDWVTILLMFGPMSFGTIPQEFLAKLRARNWWPPINPFRMCWWIIAWYFPLSVTLYNKYRRRARLPVEWTKDEMPLPGENNAFLVSGRDSQEAAGRRKAAWIIGTLSGLCTGIGIYLYSLAAIAMIHG